MRYIIHRACCIATKASSRKDALIPWQARGKCSAENTREIYFPGPLELIFYSAFGPRWNWLDSRSENINIPFLLKEEYYHAGETQVSSKNSLSFSLRKRNEIKLRMEEIIMEFVLDGALKFKGNSSVRAASMHILSVNNRYILNYFPEFTLSLRITFERSPFSIYASSRRCIRWRI